MESSDEIGVRVESLIQQVDQLSEKAESLASSDTGKILQFIYNEMGVITE